MAVRRTIPEYDGTYFITITCARWLHLFEIANGYDVVYQWFDYLKSIGHFIVGYGELEDIDLTVPKEKS